MLLGDAFAEEASTSEGEAFPSRRENTEAIEEQAMHVILGDRKRHRLTIDAARAPSHGLHFENARTACGKRIIGYYAPVADAYEGDLCHLGCFTPYERQLAAALAVDAASADAKQWEAFEREEVARKKKRAEDRAADQRRIDIATGRHPKIEKPEGEK